ncbi:transglycosylase family protein, partial [Kitasatospora kazusensis]|uniref:transglycosylase family protein n=1 Tax=Kitasatospora kazusensis TaxID=407974 RepID=UPI0031D2B156
MNKLSGRKAMGSLVVSTVIAGALVSGVGAGSASAASVSTWEKVAQCESGNVWNINTGNTYYGGLQINMANWNSYGGTQYAARPDLASEREQILIAEKILADQGAGAWTCSPGTGLATDHANPYPSTHAGTESGGAGRVRWADWDGDGKADYIILGDDG